MLKQTLLLTGLALTIAAPAAYADQLTDTGDNVTYTLTYNTTSTAGTYDVYLTIDASHYDGNSTKYPDYLNDVAFQLAGKDSDYTVSKVYSSQAGYASGVVPGGLNSSGCNNSGSGFYCLAYTGSGLGLATGATGDSYTFEFVVTDLDGFGGAHGLYTGNQSNVEANYEWFNTKTGVTGGQKDNEVLTLTPAATPEPSSLILLGTGLIGAAGTLRRRFKA
jgi:hypothetical protein